MWNESGAGLRSGRTRDGWARVREDGVSQGSLGRRCRLRTCHAKQEHAAHQSPIALISELSLTSPVRKGRQEPTRKGWRYQDHHHGQERGREAGVADARRGQ
jgi:hypothetical protein